MLAVFEGFTASAAGLTKRLIPAAEVVTNRFLPTTP